MGNNLTEIIYNVSALIALGAMVTAFLRMIIGPTIADRAVALDAMTLVTISLIAFLTLLLQRKVYLDVAIVYALISFLGVIAVARFLDKGL